MQSQTPDHGTGIVLEFTSFQCFKHVDTFDCIPPIPASSEVSFTQFCKCSLSLLFTAVGASLSWRSPLDLFHIVLAIDVW